MKNLQFKFYVIYSKIDGETIRNFSIVFRIFESLSFVTFYDGFHFFTFFIYVTFFRVCHFFYRLYSLFLFRSFTFPLMKLTENVIFLIQSHIRTLNFILKNDFETPIEFYEPFFQSWIHRDSKSRHRFKIFFLNCLINWYKNLITRIKIFRKQIRLQNFTFQISAEKFSTNDFKILHSYLPQTFELKSINLNWILIEVISFFVRFKEKWQLNTPYEENKNHPLQDIHINTNAKTIRNDDRKSDTTQKKWHIWKKWKSENRHKK